MARRKRIFTSVGATASYYSALADWSYLPMEFPQPALAGHAGRLTWAEPKLTEHVLLSDISLLAPKLLGLLQIGITCPFTNPNCHAG